jgi:hypothetical protein
VYLSTDLGEYVILGDDYAAIVLDGDGDNREQPARRRH